MLFESAYRIKIVTVSLFPSMMTTYQIFKIFDVPVRDSLVPSLSLWRAWLQLIADTPILPRGHES